MKLIAQNHAAESGHWYTQAGEPAYTIVGRNGKERKTTLGDARKLNLVPSVTTILNVVDKPGLNRWKEDQMLMAALTLPKGDDESLDSFKRRAWQDAQEHSKTARETGTAIHAALESAYSGGVWDAQYDDHVAGAIAAIRDLFGEQKWTAEASFCHPLGYGGKCDLHCDTVVLDFKTKEFGPDDQLKLYDEHEMQLAAYAHGLGVRNAQRGIVFVSVNNPGLTQIVMCPDNTRGWDMFLCLLGYWRLSKNFFPVRNEDSESTH